MAVAYANFNDVNVHDYDAVVVGCGFAGAVSANQFAEGGMKVLMVEQRAQIAGNMYDELDENGILVHKYGPHIFHTNSGTVWRWLRMFSGFTAYQHKVLANLNGTFMPVPFNKKSMVIAFGEEKAEKLTQKLIDAFGDNTRVTITQLREQEDPDLKEVADYVYSNVFLYYTQKQWGLTPDQVDPSVVARVPVLISQDDRYFQDAYQGMPVWGYTKLFEEMLSHENITVCLNTKAEDVLELQYAGDGEEAAVTAVNIQGKPFTGPIVYTGPLDELLDVRFGRLPYRSLDFVYETHDVEFFQPCGTVNYTVSEDYTRITEFKHMTLGKKQNKTTIMKEYSREYVDPATQIPYYAIINDENRAHHMRYVSMLAPVENFYPLGRLAEYKYYNMDAIIERALTVSRKIMGL